MPTKKGNVCCIDCDIVMSHLENLDNFGKAVQMLWEEGGGTIKMFNNIK